MKNNHDEFKARFFKDLGGLAITLGEQVSKERLQAYFDILTDRGRWLEEDILANIRQAAENCKFFPKPVELMGGKDPAVAWQEVMKAVESVGPYGNVEFSDGAIAAAVMGLGGWPSLCEMGYEELTLQRIPARFAALYTEAIRHRRHRSSGTVNGIIDRDNAARGYELESPAIKAKTMDEIMDLAKPKRPAMKLIEAPKQATGIPPELHQAADKLIGKVKF